MLRQSLVVGAVAAGTWLHAETHAADPGVFLYHYFDEPKPLILDAARFAVRASEHLDPADHDRRLARAGVSVDEIASHAVSPWRIAPVPKDRRDAEAAREFIEGAAAVADHFVSPIFFDELGGPLIVTPHILVQFRDDVAQDRAQAILTAAGLVVLNVDWANMPGTYRAASASRSGFEVLAQANVLAMRAETIYAEPDMIFTGSGGSDIPNDSMFSALWGLRNTGQSIGSPCFVGGGTTGMDMGAVDAWKVTTGDSSIIVVVIDTGVVFDHPDLMALPPLGADFTGENGGGWPVNGCDTHGTPVAGGVAAIKGNGIGVAGIAPGTRLASARPFISNCNGSGWDGQGSWTVAALDWAQSIGARVTNNSNYYGFQSAAIASKYVSTRAAGIVHFASAGNFSSPNLTYPASLSSVNAVAALNRFGNLAWFSNWGTGLAFSAPGEHIASTANVGYTCFGGTSAASPYAAGVAALVLSIHPELAASQVEDILANTAVDLGPPGYDTTFGWGLVNAAAAVGAEPTPLPPSNNTCTASIVVGVGEQAFSNLHATTTGPSEPALCNFAGDAQVHSDVWFRHTATCTGDLTVSLCETATDFDSKLALYGAACPTQSGAALGCNKDACDTLSSVTVPVTQGQILRIRIGGHNGEQGSGTFTVACNVPLACPGDINNDNVVNGFDLVHLLSCWGDAQPGTVCEGADLNGDNVVNGFDLVDLLSNWGPCN